MPTIEEAQQQLGQQQAQLALAQQQSQQAIRQLEQAQSTLPEATTQKALRQTYAGPTGRVKRGVIQRIKEALTGKKQQVKQFRTGLQQYEQDVLIPAQQQIELVQQQQVVQQAQQQAYEAARQMYEQKVPMSATSNPLVRQYLQEFMTSGAASREAFTRSVAQIQSEFPEEQLVVDWENLKVQGVQSGSLSQTLPVKEYNRLARKFPTTDISFTEIPPSQFEVTPQQSLFTGGRGVVDLPPSTTSQFIEQIKEKGPITGTLFYLGEKAKGFVTERELKQPDPYQPYALGRLAKLGTEVAPYLTPAGLPLLVIGGAEKLGFGTREYKGKPSALSREKAKLEKEGVSPILAGTFSYGVPIVEIGLGGLGIGAKLKASQFAKILPKTEVVGTFQKLPKGTRADVLAKTGRTQRMIEFPTGRLREVDIGEQVFTIGTQVVEPIEGTKLFRSMGKGFTVKGKEIKPFISLSSGVEAGPGYAVREKGLIKLRGQLGKGSIIDKSTGIIYRQVGDKIYAYQGGKAVLRLNKVTGKVSYVVKQPTIKGRLIEIPAELKGGDIKILQPAGIKKTPLSKTFQEIQEQKLISQFLGDISKSTEVKLTPVKPVTPVSKTTPLSIQTQEAITQPSLYAGTGLYERTENIGGFVPGRQVDFIGIDTSEKIKVDSRLGLGIDFRTRSRQQPVSFLGAASLTDTIQRQPPIFVQRAKLRDIQDIRQPQIVSLAQIQRPKQIQRPQPVQIQVPKPGEPQPKKGKFLLPIPGLLDGKKKKFRPLSLRKLPQVFFAITKRYGKERVVGIGRTVREAEAIGRKEVLGTLAATLKVKTPSGRQVQLKSDRIFRISKTDPLAIVQRRRTPKGGRLASKGERIEIIGLRKSKSTKRGKPLSLK